MLKNKGRLTKQKNLELHKELQKCYLKGHSAPYAAEKLGIDKKTAYDHYQQIHDTFVNVNNRDFFETANAILEQTITCYDTILDEYFDTFEFQKKRIESYEEHDESAPNELIQTKITLLRDIRNVLKERAHLILQKPLEKSIEKKLEEKMMQYAGPN